MEDLNLDDLDDLGQFTQLTSVFICEVNAAVLL